MILTPLLLGAVGLRISVLGEGNLRLDMGGHVGYATSAILAPNAKGLLADAQGHALVPQIRVAGPFKVAMNGTVTVSGNATPVGQIVLERKPGDLGFPGEGTFGVLRIQGAAAPAAGAKTATNGGYTLAAHSNHAVIDVHARTSIDGDRILLKDVATLSGDANLVARLSTIDLGDTPILGSHRGIARYSLLAALRSQGVSESLVDIQMPPDVTVGRHSQIVDLKTLLQEGEAEAHKQFGENAPLRVDRNPGPIEVPVGDVAFETRSNRYGDHLTVTVTVVVSGRPVGDRQISYSTTAERIRVGEPVRIRVVLNGACVETDAKAKTDGMVGETIQVVTVDGASVSAIVTGAGRAEVKL